MSPMGVAEEKHKGHSGQHRAEDVIELITFGAHSVVPREAECNQEKEKGCFENACFPRLTIDTRQPASGYNDVCKCPVASTPPIHLGIRRKKQYTMLATLALS